MHLDIVRTIGGPRLPVQRRRIGEIVLLRDLPNGAVRRFQAGRGAFDLDDSAALDAGEAAQIFGARNASGPESAVDAFHADQLRSARIFAQALKANQATGDALAGMRRLQLARSLRFEPTLLLRQQPRGGALTVAPVAEADEFLLKLGIEPPHARASRFGQA